jgi:hypothetical protein
MSGLVIEVLGAGPEPYAAVPTISLRLRVSESDGLPVSAVVLRVQVRIEPQRRSHDAAEVNRLRDLFGGSTQWGESLRPFFWTELSKVIGAFSSPIEVDLPIMCTYDLEVAATRYFHAVREGEIPLVLLFSGTVFTNDGSRLVVEPVPWHLEASYRMPASCWRETMDGYFPERCWIRLSRETIDALLDVKASGGLPTLDQAIEMLLGEHAREVAR